MAIKSTTRTPRKPATPKKRATPRRAPKKRKSPKRRRIRVRNPIKVVLFHCDECKLKTNNPIKRFFHTCLKGFTAAQKRAIGERTAAQRAAARRNLQAARQARK